MSKEDEENSKYQEYYENQQEDYEDEEDEEQYKLREEDLEEDIHYSLNMRLALKYPILNVYKYYLNYKNLDSR